MRDASLHTLPLLMLALSAPAQSLLFCPQGGTPGAAAGTTVAGVGDVDQDGIGDVAVGLPQDASAGPQRGSVRIHSGRDGSELYAVHGERDGERFGQAIAVAGDVDHDGCPDFLVGSPTGWNLLNVASGYVKLYSGRDARVLRRFDGQQPSDYFGASVAGVGDVDADGALDIGVGAPETSLLPPRSGHAVVLSSATGAVIHRFAGTQAFDEFGRAVAGLGDIDLDGRPDVLVSIARSASPNLPRVHVYSGRTGGLLLVIPDVAARSGFGACVALLGDASVGSLELAIGAPAASRVDLYSITGVRRWSAAAAIADRLGTSVCRIGDVDGDGTDDIASGAPGNLPSTAPGRVAILSGRTGGLIRYLSLGTVGDGFGTSVGSVTDLDTDGRSDLAVGAPGHGLGGQACLYAALTPSFVEYGHGCAGQAGVPRLFATLPPRIGGVMEIRVAPLRWLRIGVVTVGISDRAWGSLALPADLTPMGMPGCSLFGSIEAMFDVSTGTGTAVLQLPIPSERTLLRAVLFHQSLTLDESANAAGIVASNAGRAVIGV